MNKIIEPKNLFVFLSVVFISSILIFGLLGFYIGSSTNSNLGYNSLSDTQDASAALETNANLDEGDTNNKDCAFNGAMVYCVPKYAFANQRSKLIVNYFPFGFKDGNFPNSPEWEITICKKKYTTSESYKEYSFRFPNRACPITVKLLPGTEFETIFTKEYTPINNIKNFKMSEPSYLSEIGVDYDATPILGDLTSGLTGKGISESMIEDVIWDYKYTSDYCSASVNRDFTTKTKYSGFIYPDSVGRCRVKLTAYVVTCTDCASSKRIVYTSSNILTSKVIQEGIMPSPTSYWYPPTVTPTFRPTPSVYPTSSAVTIKPKTNSVIANSENEVSILVNPPSDNISSLQVRLKVEGASIVQGSFSSGGNYLTIGTCENDSMYTTDKVCFDISGLNPFSNDQVIASFKIKTNTTSPIYIKTDEDNAYFIDGESYYSQEEILGTYYVLFE